MGGELLRLEGIWQEVLSHSRYEQGRMLGRLMFEIVGPAAVFARAGMVSKLEFLTQIRAKPIFQNPRLARVFYERLAALRAELTAGG